MTGFPAYFKVMSNDSKRNSAANAAANSKVHHVRLEDVKQYTPEKLDHLTRGGIRSGPARNPAQAQEMIDKVPPSQRAGVDGRTAASNLKKYLSDKDASHIKPHSKGGSSNPSNIKWENKSANRARGDKPMTREEQTQLDAKAGVDNLTGALNAGLRAAPRGAVIGAVTTAPFSMLRNALRVVRGEISAGDAAMATVKETAIGGGVGTATAFTVTTVAAACPPIAVALSAVSPILLAAGGAGMVYEFFKILGDHKQKVKEYYQSLAEHDLKYLREVEKELVYEHAKNLAFLSETEALHTEISDRPIESGIEGALKRYRESAAIAASLGVKPVGSQLLVNAKDSKKSLPGSN